MALFCDDVCPVGWMISMALTCDGHVPCMVYDGSELGLCEPTQAGWPMMALYLNSVCALQPGWPRWPCGDSLALVASGERRSREKRHER